MVMKKNNTQAAEDEEIIALGFDYLEPEQSERAFKFLSREAKAGNPEAFINLAIQYARGTGVEKDYRKAIDLFKQALEIMPTNGDAAGNLSLIYLREHDLENAKIAADQAFDLRCNPRIFLQQYGGPANSVADGDSNAEEMKRIARFYREYALRVDPDEVRRIDDGMEKNWWADGATKAERLESAASIQSKQSIFVADDKANEQIQLIYYHKMIGRVGTEGILHHLKSAGHVHLSTGKEWTAAQVNAVVDDFGLNTSTPRVIKSEYSPAASNEAFPISKMPLKPNEMAGKIAWQVGRIFLILTALLAFGLVFELLDFLPDNAPVAAKVAVEVASKTWLACLFVLILCYVAGIDRCYVCSTRISDLADDPRKSFNKRKIGGEEKKFCESCADDIDRGVPLHRGNTDLEPTRERMPAYPENKGGMPAYPEYKESKAGKIAKWIIGLLLLALVVSLTISVSNR